MCGCGSTVMVEQQEVTSGGEPRGEFAVAEAPLWEPGVWGDRFVFEAELGAADAAEAEGSDGDCGEDAHGVRDEVILEQHPEGLEICPTSPAGCGALVTQPGSVAAAMGVQPGASILSINSHSVEDLPTEEIRNCLHEASLPVALQLKPMLNLPRAKKLKARSKDPVTICTAHCRESYRVVQASLAQLGWKEMTAESRDSSVIWLELSDPTDGIAPVQTVSRLEAFLHMCRKAPLARCLNSWIEELPEEFTFVPTTWVLPYDASDLEATMSKGRSTYIAKPSAGTQGKGIVLARRWNDLSEVVQKAQGLKDGVSRSEYVVQRYIEKPLLLDGLKFDMRIYVVVTSVVPLRAYLFKEGLARFCTVPYQAPKDGNLRDTCMHLTNFAVNKQSKDFQVSEGLSSHDEGSKRSASSVFWQIEQTHGVTVAELWSNIAKLTANTLMAIRPGLLEHYVQLDTKRTRALHPFAPKGFQILGLDVLLNSKLEPKLIEINANPSLSVMQPGRASPLAASPLSSPMPASCDLPPSQQRDFLDSPTTAHLAAGSGLQAARMAMNCSSISGISKLDLGAGIGCVHDDAIPRIVAKLQTLSEHDVATVEHFVDALFQAPANQTSDQLKKVTKEPGGRLPVASSSLLESLCAQSAQGHVATFSSENDDSMQQDADRGATSASRVIFSSPDSVRQRTERGRRSLQTQSKQRLGLFKPATQEKPKKNKMVTSPLDLEIKRELVAQALLLAKPAPQNKVSRLRKQWMSEDAEAHESVPLNDKGTWISAKATHPEVRHDAPERCPCLEALDFEDLVIPEVSEYARAHFDLYRIWLRSCGPGQSSVGQAQMLKLLERRGLVGAGQLFAERIEAQLWLTKVWRTAADGAFGLDLPQFVRIASWLGAMMRGEEVEVQSERAPVSGLLEFVRSGGAALE